MGEDQLEAARLKGGEEPKRTTLPLTWLDRVTDAKTRAELPPGMRRRDASAMVGDGTLYVAVMEAAKPRGIPDAVSPIAIHIAVILEGENPLTMAGATVPSGKGRPPTVTEIDAVCHQFARGRVMALLFDGGGVVQNAPAYWELVELAGAVMSAPGAPQSLDA
jgi:hypothetical protein